MKQIIMFGIVGAVATLVDFGVMVILKEVLGFGVLLSSAISFCTSVFVNYILSMAFVFKSKNQGKVKEFSAFFFLSVGGLLLDQMVLWIGINFTTLYYLILKVIATVVVMAYNFITRKVFLESKEK